MPICTACKTMYMGSHTCPPKLLIRLPDDSGSDDWYTVYAPHNAREAIEQWAEQNHARLDWFSELAIEASYDNGANWQPYTITVESSPVFFAAPDRPKAGT